MAPHGTDMRQRILESLVQGELSPFLDRLPNADHNCPLDTCTHSHALQRAGSEQITNGCGFSARTRMAEAEFDDRMGETEEAQRHWHEELDRLTELRDNTAKVQSRLD